MKNTVGYAKTGAMVKRCFSPETLLKNTVLLVVTKWFDLIN